MPSTGEIREQVAIETRRRQKLAVPAFGGGFLYLLSAIIITETLNGAPTVGLVQGLTPALSGVANPAVGPRTAEVKFVSRHAFTLIAGGTLAAIAFVMLTLILLLLVDATSFRRPETWRYARPLVLGGGIAVAFVSIGRQSQARSRRTASRSGTTSRSTRPNGRSRREPPTCSPTISA